MQIESFYSQDIQMARLGKHRWSVARLCELSKGLTLLTIPLDHLCVSYLYENLRLRDMVSHMKAVNEADLNYPIILDEDGDIMDGRHRVMKAMLQGHETILAVRFDKNPRPCQVDD